MAFADPAFKQQQEASSKSTNQSASGGLPGQGDALAVQAMRLQSTGMGHNPFRPEVYKVSGGYVS